MKESSSESAGSVEEARAAREVVLSSSGLSSINQSEGRVVVPSRIVMRSSSIESESEYVLKGEESLRS